MRKKYAEEYKTSAVNMVLLEGKSPTEVAHNLGICVSLLHKWIRKHKNLDSKGKLSNSEEEIQRLKNEIQELKKQLATSERVLKVQKTALRKPSKITSRLFELK
jgi:transposase-like protein